MLRAMTIKHKTVKEARNRLRPGCWVLLRHARIGDVSMPHSCSMGPYDAYLANVLRCCQRRGYLATR